MSDNRAASYPLRRITQRRNYLNKIVKRIIISNKTKIPQKLNKI